MQAELTTYRARLTTGNYHILFVFLFDQLYQHQLVLSNFAHPPRVLFKWTWHHALLSCRRSGVDSRHFRLVLVTCRVTFLARTTPATKRGTCYENFLNFPGWNPVKPPGILIYEILFHRHLHFFIWPFFSLWHFFLFYRTHSFALHLLRLRDTFFWRNFPVMISSPSQTVRPTRAKLSSQVINLVQVGYRMPSHLARELDGAQIGTSLYLWPSQLLTTPKNFAVMKTNGVANGERWQQVSKRQPNMQQLNRSSNSEENKEMSSRRLTQERQMGDRVDPQPFHSRAQIVLRSPNLLKRNVPVR